jgi:ubiquinone/menaquinone biosynthesis C-methylase UbiE
MKSESYTPGHTANATDFMSKRTLQSHGAFFQQYLSSGLSVLDCGCGPGSITQGIVAAVHPGKVVGVDFGESQIERAKKDVAEHNIKNVEFIAASCYSLPFEDAAFDCVFSHALLEHLSDSKKALMEFHRVLKPGGVIGICSPDWGGFILSPPSTELSEAIEAYTKLQTKNGGDVFVGRKFGIYMASAGFVSVQMQARYECYPSLNFIGEYLAVQLRQKGDDKHADTLLAWSKSQNGLFAQTWVSAIGRK